MSAHATTDPFDDVMNLEERFYDEGYTQGTKDGDRAGKIEGRSVGLANGYDKFLESGRLYGKSLVLEKNIIVAHALVEPDTLSTENNDDAVNDFDDRVKKAQGKVKVIERMLGESETAVHGKAGGAA
ncbi:hypothetical protein ACHAP1_005618 [Verticillium nonalfalfae]